MTKGETRKPLLLFCLVASIGLHLGGVFLIYRASPTIPEETATLQLKPAPRLVPKDPEELLVERVERALEQSLNDAIAFAHQVAPKTDDIAQTDSYEAKPLYNAPKVEKEEWEALNRGEGEFASTMPPLFDPEMEAFFSSFALDHELDEIPIGFESERVPTIDINTLAQEAPAPALQMVSDDYTLTDNQFSPTALSTSQDDKLSAHLVAKLQKLSTKEAPQRQELTFTNLSESNSPRLILPNAVDYLRSQWVKRSLAEKKTPNIERYGLDTITHHLNFEEDVEIDVQIMTDPKSNRYVFSLKIHPEFQANCEPMGQNFYFLIDNSKTIESHKYGRFKRAVQRAMNALHEGDKFNICILGKKVTQLSDAPLPFTPRTLEKATEFLEREKSAIEFTPTDLFSTLKKILPNSAHPDEIHSVILMTDGKNLLSTPAEKKELTKWATRTEDKFHFYTAASGKGNNLVMLDLVSYITGGSLLYSDTNAGFPRKLVHLIKDLHNPIVKNLSVEIAAKDPSADVSIEPKIHHFPPMFAGQPYEIVGTMDELCDLTLYLQGQNHDQWVNVHKTVSFHQAPPGGRALERLWADVQSKICYEHYLKNGKNTHLEEAKSIARAHRGVIASE